MTRTSSQPNNNDLICEDFDNADSPKFAKHASEYTLFGMGSYSRRSSGFVDAADSRPDTAGDVRRNPARRETTRFHRRRLAAQLRRPIFEDTDLMKEQVREALLKPHYHVEDLYSLHGFWQRVAKTGWFEIVTLAVIAINSVWIAIDSDLNTEALTYEASPMFQVGDHFFCVYFSLELFIRFMAFRRKLDVFKDAWFMFDAALVCLMVLDTWITSIIYLTLGPEYTMSSPSVLRLLRILRLIRVARMARLVRMIPELLVLIKGMCAAVRSVTLTLFLLLVALYFFAIIFSQVTRETDVHLKFFPTVVESMKTLLICGTFLDSIGILADELYHTNVAFFLLFLIFVLLTAFTLMNMLIGVLCEVVSEVAQCERENSSVVWVNSKLESIVAEFDRDDDRLISKSEFQLLMQSKEALKALDEVGIDPAGLVDLVDEIFQGYDDDGNVYDKELNFVDFMNAVLQFRGSNSATMKDLINLQKFIRKQVTGSYLLVESRLKIMEEHMKKYINSQTRDVNHEHSYAWSSDCSIMSAAEDRLPATTPNSSIPPTILSTPVGHNDQHADLATLLTTLSNDLHARFSRLERILLDSKEDRPTSRTLHQPSTYAACHTAPEPCGHPRNASFSSECPDIREKLALFSSSLAKPPSRGLRQPPGLEGGRTANTLGDKMREFHPFGFPGDRFADEC